MELKKGTNKTANANLTNSGFRCKMVKYSENFIDMETGTCTQTILTIWRLAKQSYEIRT